MPPAPRRVAAALLPVALAGALGATAIVALPAVAAAQVGSTTDIVTGRVVGANGQPIEGAQVTVTSVETGVNRTRSTNAKGQYTVLFPDGGGRYTITVRAIGQLPRTVNVQRESDEDRLVANVTLGAAPTQLSTVRVQANRAPAGPPGGQRPEPGNTERNVTTANTGRPSRCAIARATASSASGTVGSAGGVASDGIGAIGETGGGR